MDHLKDFQKLVVKNASQVKGLLIGEIFGTRF
jgi:hypothetical protein